MADKNKAKASKETLEKVQAMKKKVESTISGRMQDVTQRRLRTLRMQHQLKQNPNLDDQKKNELMNEYYKEEKKLLRDTRKKLGLKDFKCIKVIGKGAFGEVRIVRNKNDNVVYAMKTMRKKDMIAKNQVAHVKAERDLMANASNTSSFLVKLHFSFQDDTYLYLVMEYCGGGDLMGLLIKKDILSEAHTRFYMAELAAAINYVHELGYVHRDLKPDNVLISNEGHIRLSDFGLAKSFQSSNDKQLENWQQFVATLKQGDIEKMKQEDAKMEDEQRRKNGKREKVDRKKLYSTVGTPDYIAIEVLYQKGYDKKVDWWSMGVIMFECLVGYAPFHANDPLATCRKIVRYERYFKIPSDIKLTKHAVLLMKDLVCPAHRRKGWEQIKKHPWFADVNWDNLKGHKPPFVPKLKNEVDATYFDEIEEEQDIEEVDENVKQSGYSTAADEQNRVWGYTFNRNDAQGFKEYARKAKQAQLNAEKLKKKQDTKNGNQ